MKEYEPSDNFVRNVMRAVRNFELRSIKQKESLPQRLFASAAFRYVMSGGGVFLGIFLTPIACA